MKKKKVSRAEFMRAWGLDPRKVTLRYKNPLEKGVYWHYFSLMVRKRDVEKYGTCISCGKPITVDTCHAGHFMPARDCGPDLIFSPLNVHAECAKCNGFDETHLLGYAEELDRRYGAGLSQGLRDIRKAYKAGPPVKDHKAEVYAQQIRELTGLDLPKFD